MSAPARPVRWRGPCSWIEDLPGGGVRLTVYRRVGQAEAAGGWDVRTFVGDTDADVERQYGRYCAESHEKSVKQAARRARWGPLGTGKMS